MLLRRRLRLPQVTLVCVAGIKPFAALRAVLISMCRVKFAEVVFVTTKFNWISGQNFLGIHFDRPVESRLDSMEEYNRYIVYQLYRHVCSTHVLLIQADGYVLSSKCWREEFLEYDYIGAPWPTVNDSYITPFGDQVQVGNGGFSLRSKRLLEVPLRHIVTFEVNADDFYNHFNKNSNSEDGVICVHNRHIYVSAGCRFAPVEIAAQFSRELKIPGVTKNDTFGFHRYK